MDYFAAKNLLAKRAANLLRTGESLDLNPSYTRKLKHQTYLTYSEKDAAGVEWTPEVGDAFIIKYFGNAILHLRANFFTIDSHGWFSHSTNERLNEFMPPGFRVWGQTYSWCRSRGPLGFIRTPSGVFPYTMPISFYYNGRERPAELGNDPCMVSCAQDVVAAIRPYIGQYIRRLLAGELGARFRGVPELDSLPRCLEAELLNPAYPAQLLQNACQAPSCDYEYDGLSLAEIGRVLIQEGKAAFASSTSRLENSLRHRLPIGALSTGWLRAAVRDTLSTYLVDALGFDELRWNRR
jgi:hypothetical protein